MSQSQVDFNSIEFREILTADTAGTVDIPAVVHPNGWQEAPQLIRQFNNSWTYVKRLHRGGDVIGWEFRCECGTQRKFLPQYFNDPYQAAVHARDTHGCSA